MKMVKQLMIIILTVMLVASSSVLAKDSESRYVYPITIMSDNWFDYSVLEKVEMLRIDDQTLKQMNDKQLIEAIADYPYLVDIYFFDSLKEGLESFAYECSAYCELIRRPDYERSLEIYGKMLIDYYRVNPRRDGQTEFVIFALQDIMETVCGTSHEEIQRFSDENQVGSSNSILSVPTTPSGGSVVYSTPSEGHTSSYHSASDNNTVATYGVELIRVGSCRYNCHSYAWHSTSSSNIYWIPSPQAYMNDSYYTNFYTGSTSATCSSLGLCGNDRIVYSGNAHSAIFAGNPYSNTSIGSALVISKWGQAGVFRHTLTNVPAIYGYSTIRIYKPTYAQDGIINQEE